MDMTPEEFQEVFIPGDKQEEFMYKTYDAYIAALSSLWMDQVDPNNFLNRKKDD